MNFLFWLLLATTTAPNPGRPRACTPPRSGQRVQMVLARDADLTQMAEWARTALCVEYVFAVPLAGRRLPESVHVVLDGGDAAKVFEIPIAIEVKVK